jgi:two-component system response regulator RegA
MTDSLLYLEDDEVLAQVTINAFRRRGFLVEHYASLSDARLALDHWNFSHALLDMKLSDGNALGFIAELVEKHPMVKILLLTGYASIATAVQAIKLGAYNYLAKPASIEEIMAAFGEQLTIVADSNDTMSLKRLEWEKIQQALIENGGNISLTAHQLNMHRRTLQRKLGKKPVPK